MALPLRLYKFMDFLVVHPRTTAKPRPVAHRHLEWDRSKSVFATYNAVSAFAVSNIMLERID